MFSLFPTKALFVNLGHADEGERDDGWFAAVEQAMDVFDRGGMGRAQDAPLLVSLRPGHEGWLGSIFPVVVAVGEGRSCGFVLPNPSMRTQVPSCYPKF